MQDKEIVYNQSVLNNSNSYLDEYGKKSLVKSFSIKNQKNSVCKDLFFRKAEIKDAKNSSVSENNVSPPKIVPHYVVNISVVTTMLGPRNRLLLLLIYRMLN